MRGFIARLAAAGRVIAAAGMLAWFACVMLTAVEAGTWPEGVALAFMAGSYGLALWLGLALVLVPAAWCVPTAAAGSVHLREALACSVGAAAWMLATFWPLRALALAALPASLAYHEALASIAAAYGCWGSACAATWIAWRRLRRSHPLPAWSLAPLLVVARWIAVAPLAEALPGREAWADGALMAVLGLCFIGSVARVPRAIWPLLGAAWVASVTVLFTSFTAHPAARAVFAATYPGAAGLVGGITSLVDIDGDGVSAWLGGADCDDFDATVSPFALEIAGNRIDDNCLGGDLPLVPRNLQPTAAGVGPRHNLVLVTLDATRADLLDAEHMPNLRRLSERAATFTRAYTVVPYTTDSTRTMLTGQLLANMAVGFQQDLGREPSLQERLRDAGYDTSIVLHRWWDEAGSWWAYAGFKQRIEVAPGQTDIYRSVTGPAVTEGALAEISRLAAAGRPYFVWIHYVDPHAEYMPRAATPFSDRSDLRSLYHQEVWSTDREFGRLLEHLESLGFFERGVLAVHSDHGELIEPGGRVGHALWLDEGVLRVLLVVRGPSVPAGVYSTRVSLVDVFPTLLELTAGLAAPSFGRSLAPIWQRSETADREVFVYSPYPGSRQGALLQGPHKLVQDFLHGTERLYDLSRDPAERDNLVEARPEIAARLKARYGEVWDRSMNDRVLARRAHRKLSELCQAGDQRACAALERAAMQR